MIANKLKWQELGKSRRDTTGLGNGNIRGFVEERRASCLELSKRRLLPYSRQFTHSVPPAVSSLDINRPEQRYILCGLNDGSIAISDLEVFQPAFDKYHPPYRNIATVPKNASYGHNFAVSNCQWYPFDSGMFVTAGGEKSVRVWDTNVLRPVRTFTLTETVSCLHWSPVPSSNPLIAIAAGTSNVKLIDLRSNSSLQQLKWHTETVNLVQWSASDSNILVSAGNDAKILVWDVRSARNKLMTVTIAKNHQKHRKHAPIPLARAIKFSENGLFFVSIATDSCLRVHNAHNMQSIASMNIANFSNNTHPKKLVSFDCFDATNSAREKGENLIVYLPAGDDLAVIRPFQNEQTLLEGHCHVVTGCRFRSTYQELFSYAADRLVLVWRPREDEIRDMQMERKRPGNPASVTCAANTTAVDALLQDSWSDDND